MLGPQLALVDLGDDSEQLCGEPTVFMDEIAKSMEQLSFRELCN